MQVKGIAVKAIKDFVENQYPNGYKNWIQALPEKSKKIFISPIDVSAWYPIQDGSVEPTKAIGKLFFDGNVNKAAYESGRHSAHNALTGIYKVFVMVASPSFIIDRASRILTSYYQPSSIVVKEKQSKTCTIQIEQLPDKSQIVEMRIAGWISKAFEVTGCKGINLAIPKSLSKNDDCTKIVITWN